MSILIALLLLFSNSFILFSSSDVTHPSADDEAPIPVYRFNETTRSGQKVNGMVVFSCHFSPSNFYLQQIGEFAKQARHFIVESDPYKSSSTTSYHADSDFISLGIFCEHNNTGELLKYFNETDHPCKELLEAYPRKNTLYTTFNRLWRNISLGFSYDNGIDTWAYESGRASKSLFCLEDICDQAQSGEEALKIASEKFEVLGFEKWKDLFKKIHAFTEDPRYKRYKSEMTEFVTGFGGQPSEFPELEENEEGEIFCTWSDQSCIDEEFNCCGRTRLQIETDEPLIYRNRIWLERLRDTILPAIDGEPFILVVGADHALVRSKSEERLGVLDFFEDLFA